MDFRLGVAAAMHDGHAVGPVVCLLQHPLINEAGVPDAIAIHQPLLQLAFDAGHGCGIPQQKFRWPGLVGDAPENILGQADRLQPDDEHQ